MDKLLALLKKLGASQEEIDAVQTDIETAKEAEVAGLKKKNSELIAKNKALSGEEGGKVAELEAQIEKLTEDLTASKKEGEKTLKALAAERDSFKLAADGEKAAVAKLLLDNGLTESLAKAGVRKELLPAARALLREKGVLSVKSEGEARKAIALIKKDGKDLELSIEDYVSKEFAASDEGKAFISGSGNSGGGAGGHNPGNGAQKPEPKSVAEAIAAAGAPPSPGL